MPEIVLEKIEEPVMEEEEAAPPEPVEQVPEEVTPEPMLEEEHVPEPPVLERQQTEAPQPKRRGRPPKAKAKPKDLHQSLPSQLQNLSP